MQKAFFKMYPTYNKKLSTNSLLVIRQVFIILSESGIVQAFGPLTMQNVQVFPVPNGRKVTAKFYKNVVLKKFTTFTSKVLLQTPAPKHRNQVPLAFVR
jgi:hypothetical protein